MTVFVPLAPTPTSLPPLPIHRFTVDQYHRMAEVGILSYEDPVELLEGLIVIKGQSTLAPAIVIAAHANGNGPVPVPLPVRRFTLDEYHRMIATGILGESEPVELLEGWVVQKMSRTPPHDVVVGLVFMALVARLPPGWHGRCQMALTTDVSEPEPDTAIVRGAMRDYLTHHPRPRDTGLAVEVSESSLSSDRSLKGAMYGRVGIPFYWIVNLPDRQVEVYSDPTGPDPNPGYRQRQDYRMGEVIPLVLDGREVGRIPAQEPLP